LLVALLVLSNLVWIFVSTMDDRVPRPASGPARGTGVSADRGELSRLDAEVRRLQAELAKRDAPEPPGRSTGEPVPPPSPPVIDGQTARTQADQWVSDAEQVVDQELRRTALEAIRRALGGNDRAACLSALWALAQLHAVDFDRESYRSGVISFLTSEVLALRAAAPTALAALRGGDPDIELLLPLVEDEAGGVRSAAGAAIARLGGTDLAGPASAPLVRLLGDEDPEVARGALEAVASRMSHPSPEIIDAILALCRSDNQQIARRAIMALRDLDPKSEGVVTSLLTLLVTPGKTDRVHLVLALLRGVGPELRAKVTSAFVAAYPKEADSGVRSQIRRWFRGQGEGDAGTVERLAENVLLPEAERTELREVAELIRARTTGGPR
jgi:hypothetical protein